MRQVEMALEGIQAGPECVYSDNVTEEKFESITRVYSLEEEFLLSARYPR
jgi:hypothetical protein